VSTVFYNGTSPNDTTVSGTNVDMAGLLASGLTKRLAGTRLRVDGNVSLYSTIGGTQVTIGVKVINAVSGATVTTVDQAFQGISLANNAVGVGWSALIAGIPAGTYNFQGVWRRGGGGGTLTRQVDTPMSLMVTEVP
jgi:hypothetical protein